MTIGKDDDLGREAGPANTVVEIWPPKRGTPEWVEWVEGPEPEDAGDLILWLEAGRQHKPTPPAHEEDDGYWWSDDGIEC